MISCLVKGGRLAKRYEMRYSSVQLVQDVTSNGQSYIIDPNITNHYMALTGNHCKFFFLFFSFFSFLLPFPPNP